MVPTSVTRCISNLDGIFLRGLSFGDLLHNQLVQFTLAK